LNARLNNCPLAVLVLLTSNERVHQNCTHMAEGPQRAISGATRLLEAVALFYFLYYFNIVLFRE